MNLTYPNVTIPDELAFSDLKLGIGANGQLTCDMAPIRAIAEASDLPWHHFLVSADGGMVDLILGWYGEHRKQGGEEDLSAEEFIQGLGNHVQAPFADSRGSMYLYDPVSGD